MIAYLSGAMEFANDEGALWRNELTIWLKNTINHQQHFFFPQHFFLFGYSSNSSSSS